MRNRTEQLPSICCRLLAALDIVTFLEDCYFPTIRHCRSLLHCMYISYMANHSKRFLPASYRVRSTSKAQLEVVSTYFRRGTKWAFAIICRPGKLIFLFIGSKLQSDSEWGLLPKNKNFPGLQMMAKAVLEMLSIHCKLAA